MGFLLPLFKYKKSVCYDQLYLNIRNVKSLVLKVKNTSIFIQAHTSLTPVRKQPARN